MHYVCAAIHPEGADLDDFVEQFCYDSEKHLVETESVDESEVAAMRISRINPNHPESESLCMSNEEYMEYDGYSEVHDEDGHRWIKRSNPHGQCDWWAFGGRWRGLLLAKPGRTGIVADQTFVEKAMKQKPVELPPNRFDSMRFKDVDFVRMGKAQLRGATTMVSNLLKLESGTCKSKKEEDAIRNKFGYSMAFSPYANLTIAQLQRKLADLKATGWRAASSFFCAILHESGYIDLDGKTAGEFYDTAVGLGKDMFISVVDLHS